MYEALIILALVALLLSPWIRDAVLNQIRLGKLKVLVERGVEVFIGYGLGEDDKPGKDKGDRAIEFLEQLAKRHTNLHFHELGDIRIALLWWTATTKAVGS